MLINLKKDFEKDFSFCPFFKELFPDESVFDGEIFCIAESKDTSNPSKVFINVWAVIAAVDESFVHRYPINFTARTVSVCYSKIRNLSSKHSLSIIESYVCVSGFIAYFFPVYPC